MHPSLCTGPRMQTFADVVHEAVKAEREGTLLDVPEDAASVADPKPVLKPVLKPGSVCSAAPTLSSIADAKPTKLAARGERARDLDPPRLERYPDTRGRRIRARGVGARARGVSKESKAVEYPEATCASLIACVVQVA